MKLGLRMFLQLVTVLRLNKATPLLPHAFFLAYSGITIFLTFYKETFEENYTFTVDLFLKQIFTFPPTQEVLSNEKNKYAHMQCEQYMWHRKTTVLHIERILGSLLQKSVRTALMKSLN